jgi:hypothetical protein
LRIDESRESGFHIASTLELAEPGVVEEVGFKDQILANPEVVQTLLRPNEVSVLVQRLGKPDHETVFYPVPLPSLGGSGELNTFEKGGLREYLAIVAQSLH